MLGIYVGFIPVGLGLLWYPFLRRLGRSGMQAVLALTVIVARVYGWVSANRAHEVKSDVR